MTKLEKFVDCIREGRNKKLTLCEMREVEDVYEALRRGQTTETISQTVSDICKISRLKVCEKGIGWSISK